MRLINALVFEYNTYSKDAPPLRNTDVEPDLRRVIISINIIHTYMAHVCDINFIIIIIIGGIIIHVSAAIKQCVVLRKT